MAKITNNRNKRSASVAFDSEDEVGHTFGDQPQAVAQDSSVDERLANSEGSPLPPLALRRSERLKTKPVVRYGVNASQPAARLARNQRGNGAATAKKKGQGTSRPAKRRRRNPSGQEEEMEVNTHIQGSTYSSGARTQPCTPAVGAEDVPSPLEAASCSINQPSKSFYQAENITGSSVSFTQDGLPPAFNTVGNGEDESMSDQTDDSSVTNPSTETIPTSPESAPPSVDLPPRPAAYTEWQWARLQQNPVFSEDLNSWPAGRDRARWDRYLQGGCERHSNPGLRRYTTNIPSLLSEDITEHYKALSEVSGLGYSIHGPHVFDRAPPRAGTEGLMRHTSRKTLDKFDMKVKKVHRDQHRMGIDRETEMVAQSANPIEIEKAARKEAKRARLASFPLFQRELPGPRPRKRLPGPPTGDFMHNTVRLLNFGAWLKATNLWKTVYIGGMRYAADWWIRVVRDGAREEDMKTECATTDDEGDIVDHYRNFEFSDF